MHVLLVGHTTAVPRLRAAAAALKLIPGTFTSLYVDKELEIINSRRGLPRADFLLIGLSRESRVETSPQHAVEADLAKRASELNPPMHCGIICDVDGNVSPPFIKQLGSTVKVVVARMSRTTAATSLRFASGLNRSTSRMSLQALARSLRP